MEAARVGAVVVTFHPDADVVENLRSLAGQMREIVVVDNGSSAEDVALLRGIASLQVIENGSNLGIATALNVGVRALRARGCAWVLLFDQDSRVTDGFVATMLADFAANGWAERLKILVPGYIDRRTGARLPVSRGAEGLEVATTSGSLTPMAVFEEFGLFRDELFIDQVDYEFSLRVRQGGGVIDEGTAILEHAPGEPVPVRVGGKVLFRSANYSPIRRYYQERNRVWMVRHYGRAFPGFAARLVLGSAKELVKMLVGERGRGAKGKAFAAGVRDGLLGRMGPR